MLVVVMVVDSLDYLGEWKLATVFVVGRISLAYRIRKAVA
jgi:hypothetical protein